MLTAVFSDGGERARSRSRYLLQWHTEYPWASWERTQFGSCWPTCESFRCERFPASFLLGDSLCSGQWRATCVLAAVLGVIHLPEELSFLYSSLSMQSWSLVLLSFSMPAFSGDQSWYLSPSGAKLIRGFGAWFYTISWPSRAARVVWRKANS